MNTIFNAHSIRTLLTLVVGCLSLGTAYAAPQDLIADRVLGAIDFTSQATAAVPIYDPRSITVAPNGRLFVADGSSNRVLSWPSATSFTNGQSPDLVLGQANFTALTCNRGNAAPAANTLCGVYGGLAIEPSSGNLFVADSDNNRVLMYPTPFTSGMNATLVFGQLGSFTTNTANLTASGFSGSGPSGLAFDRNGSLWVADKLNHRVLRFNWPFSGVGGNTTADLVIGQANMTSALQNTSRNGLNYPAGLAVDAADNLYVADYFNNRVMRFKPPFANNMLADMVLGQNGNFTGNAAASGAAGFDGVNDLKIDATGNLFVADAFNKRVLMFQAPISTNSAALVLGQPDFNTVSAGLSSTKIDRATGVALDSLGNLYVSDQPNSRVLAFDRPYASTFTATSATLGPIPDGTGGGCGAPLDVQIPVSGLSGSVRTIAVSTIIQHTYVGDLEVTLIAPNNGTSHRLMGRVGKNSAISAGYQNALSYQNATIFADFGDSDLWNNTVPGMQTGLTYYRGGLFRTTADGGANAAPRASLTTLAATYGGLAGFAANSTWTVRVRDCGAGTTGTIFAASLSFYMDSAPIMPPVTRAGNLAARTDFSGDGFGDVMWSSAAADLALWTMKSNALLNPLGLGNFTGLSVAAVGDLNGDGKSDMVLRGNASGALFGYLMNGSGVISSALIENPTSDFTVVGSGDFDGDGKKDLLLRSTSTGLLVVWLMDGLVVKAAGALEALDANWSIAGVGDVDGDGRADIVLRYGPTGLIAVWRMAGTVIAQANAVEPLPATYVISGLADTDGDGKMDLILTYTPTNVVVRLSLGIAAAYPNPVIFTSGAIVGTLNAGQSIVSTADFDGDGRTDLLVRDATGNNSLWLMNGNVATVVTTTGLSNAPTAWTAAK